MAIVRSKQGDFARRALGAAGVALGILCSARAEAQSPDPRAGSCGNGYCDGWAGEDPSTCPADCIKREKAPGAPVSYPPPYYAPRPDRWRPGDLPPPGYHVEQGPVRGLLLSGAILMTVGYFAGLGVGSTNFDDGGSFAAIPLVGPFVAGGAYRRPPPAMCQDIGCAAGAVGAAAASSINEGLYKFGLYALGVMQLTGTGLLIAGSVLRRDRLVPDHGVTLLPVPLTVAGGSGLGLAGTF